MCDTADTSTVRQLRMRGTGRAKPAPKPDGGHWQRETQAQIAVVQWARKRATTYPCLAWLHSIPNGFHTADKRHAAVLRRAGLTKGISDLYLPYPSGPYHGLYIELKHGRNKPTPEQDAFISYANSVGYRAVVCYGAEAAIRAIEDYITGAMEPAVCPF